MLKLTFAELEQINGGCHHLRLHRRHRRGR